MPTDVSLARGRWRAERLIVAHDEILMLLALALFGFLSALMAVRSPAIASALILAGLQ